MQSMHKSTHIGLEDKTIVVKQEYKIFVNFEVKVRFWIPKLVKI